MLADRLAELLRDVPGVHVEEVDEAGLVIGLSNQAAKADVMQVCADVGAEHPVIVELAGELRRVYVSDEDVARAALAGVQSYTWREEHGERFQLPHVTARLGYGDCDCLVILLVAILLAAGVKARCVTLSDVGADWAVNGKHASCQVDVGLGWVWAEPSVRCQLGDDPRELARRPGVVLSGR